MSFNEANAGDESEAPRWMMRVNLASMESGRGRRMAELGAATKSRNSSRHKCGDTNTILSY
jgi:hypothetical protein